MLFRICLNANMTNISPARASTIVLVLFVYYLCWQFLLPRPDYPNFAANFAAIASTPLATETSPSVSTRPGTETPFYAETFVNEGANNKAHAASILSQHDQVIAYWYGGSDEGARDVKIFQASFDKTWNTPRPLIGPEDVAQDLSRFIRKVGNPVGVRLQDGRNWLFFVSVSVGGWAGSSINLIESIDDGKTWGPVRRLITSPFFNLSTLVRNPPIFYNDGSIGLPVYHEFIGKFGELLRINPEGKIIARNRLSQGSESLQPTIVPTSATSAIALMRYAGPPPRNALELRSEDGGHSWSLPQKNKLPNPNGAISIINSLNRSNGAGVLAALNNSVMGRHDMSLAYLDLQSNEWEVITAIEDADISPARHDVEFSYPALVQDQQGMYHLLYSWNHKFIKHVRFNQAWLEQHLP